MHVLVINPDPQYYREVLPVLSQHGASGAFARTAMAACDQIEAQTPDLILMCGSALEAETGVDALFSALGTHVRRVVIVYSNATAGQVGAGLERERLESLLTSVGTYSPRRRLRYRQVGDLRLDVARQRAKLHEAWVRLPRIQFRILRHLMEHTGELVPYRELMKAGWGLSGESAEARELLKDHLRRIRRRMGTDFLPYLQSVRGEGYVLVDPLEEE